MKLEFKVEDLGFVVKNNLLNLNKILNFILIKKIQLYHQEYYLWD
jgi:hypothetical protein